jgi:hypothetical protein
VVPKPHCDTFGIGTTPALRATPPNLGGEFFQKSNCAPILANRAGMIVSGVSHDVPKVC